MKDVKGWPFEDLRAGWSKHEKQVKGFEMGRNLMCSKKGKSIDKQGTVG